MAWWSATDWAMPLIGIHAAGPHGSPGAAAPRGFWELFRGEKSPAGGKQSLPRLCAAVEQTRQRRVRADVGIGPYILANFPSSP